MGLIWRIGWSVLNVRSIILSRRTAVRRVIMICDIDVITDL